MSMFMVDVTLIVIVCLFVLFGLFFGLVHTLGSLVGTILGILITTRLIDPAFETFGFLLGGGGAAKVVLFIIIFLLFSRVIGLLFWLVERAFGFVSFLPFAKTLNRLLGGAFGLAEGAIFVGVATYLALQYLPDAGLKAAIEQSAVADGLVGIVGLLMVLFPESLRVLE